MSRRLRFLAHALRNRFAKRLNGPFVTGFLVETESGTFAVDPADDAVGRTLRVTGDYGCHELEALRTRINDGERVLVVGAHIGTIAIPLSRWAAEVVAIEANPRTFRLLEMNVGLNQATNCRIIHSAASDSDEPLRFLASRSNTGGSKRVPKIAASKYYYDSPDEITVPACRLDDRLENHDFALIVMDVEGGEYAALRGMPQILSRARTLAIEYLPHHLRNVSGVSVAEFLSVIAPHFTRLTVPTRGRVLEPSEWTDYLTQMYEAGQGDPAILFEKT